MKKYCIKPRPKPVTPCLMSKSFSGVLFWLCWQQHSLGLIPHPVCCSPGQIYLKSLASPTSPKQYSLTFTASHKGFSGLPGMDSPATFLASTALLNPRGRFHRPFNLIFFKTLNQGWYCQVALPAWDNAWPVSWIIFAKALLNYCPLKAKNNAGNFLSHISG